MTKNQGDGADELLENELCADADEEDGLVDQELQLVDNELNLVWHGKPQAAMSVEYYSFGDILCNTRQQSAVGRNEC